MRHRRTVCVALVPVCGQFFLLTIPRRTEAGWRHHCIGDGRQHQQHDARGRWVPGSRRRSADRQNSVGDSGNDKT